jgi:hypothetical protein
MEKNNKRLHITNNSKEEQNNIKDFENFETQNLKIQEEAKQLIMKTKKIIENLDSNVKLNLTEVKNTMPVLSKEFDKEIKENKEVINSSFESFRQVRSSKSPKTKKEKSHSIINRSYTDIKSSNKILEDEVIFKTYNNISTSSIQQRLLEKVKECKVYERELKDKNSLIQKLHIKLDRKNEEITKLNEVLTQERSCNLKVEVATLNRKLVTKEKNIEEQKKIYDSLLFELKSKISNLVSFNDSSVNRIKYLEEENFKMIEDNKKFENEIIELQNNLNMYREKFDIEQKVKLKLQKDFESYENRVKKLFNIMKNLNEFKSEERKIENKMFHKIKIFYSSEAINCSDAINTQEEDIYYRNGKGLNDCENKYHEDLKHKSYSEYNQYRSEGSFNPYETVTTYDPSKNNFSYNSSNC